MKAFAPVAWRLFVLAVVGKIEARFKQIKGVQTMRNKTQQAVLTFALLMLSASTTFAAEAIEVKGAEQGIGILMLVFGFLAILVVGFAAITRSMSASEDNES